MLWIINELRGYIGGGVKLLPSAALLTQCSFSVQVEGRFCVYTWWSPVLLLLTHTFMQYFVFLSYNFWFLHLASGWISVGEPEKIDAPWIAASPGDDNLTVTWLSSCWHEIVVHPDLKLISFHLLRLKLFKFLLHVCSDLKGAKLFTYLEGRKKTFNVIFPHTTLSCWPKRLITLTHDSHPVAKWQTAEWRRLDRPQTVQATVAMSDYCVVVVTWGAASAPLRQSNQYLAVIVAIFHNSVFYFF